MKTSPQRLREVGQSPWIDYITRDFVRGDELANRVQQGVAGLTSNPTIFQEAIAEGDSYENHRIDLLGLGDDPAVVLDRAALSLDHPADQTDHVRLIGGDSA